jgi:hypothetical protein
MNAGTLCSIANDSARSFWQIQHSDAVNHLATIGRVSGVESQGKCFAYEKVSGKLNAITRVATYREKWGTLFSHWSLKRRT